MSASSSHQAIYAPVASVRPSSVPADYYATIEDNDDEECIKPPQLLCENDEHDATLTPPIVAKSQIAVNVKQKLNAKVDTPKMGDTIKPVVPLTEAALRA